jgi:hypothetical protein
VSELVVIITDFYAAARDVPRGAPRTVDRDIALPSLARMARYGRGEPVPDGWRAWAAAWLGRTDLAAAAPAAVAVANPRAVAVARVGDHVPDGSCASGDARADAPRAADFVWFADPVHLLAGMTSLHLAPGGILALDAGAQAELCSAFAESFAELGWRLAPTDAGRFLASGPAPTGAVRTTEPARVLGSSVAEALPHGAGAAALRSLGAEIEMWLHEHPLNVRRMRAGLPPVSTLWLWGGGPRLDARERERGDTASHGAASHEAPSQGAASHGADSRGAVSHEAASPGAASADHSPDAAVFSDDAYMAGLAHLAGARLAPEPVGIAQVAAEHAPRRIVTLELCGARVRPDASAHAAPDEPLRALETLEREWIAPALELVAHRELARLTLIANDRCISVTARDLLKVWRRRRTALEALQ